LAKCTVSVMHNHVQLYSNPACHRFHTVLAVPPPTSPSAQPATLHTPSAGILAELRKRKTYVKPKLDLRPLDTHWQQFFEGRGISAATCERNRVSQTAYGDLVFPFVRHGEVVNAKFRRRESKSFHQVKDAEKVLCSQMHTFAGEIRRGGGSSQCNITGWPF